MSEYFTLYWLDKSRKRGERTKGSLCNYSISVDPVRRIFFQHQSYHPGWNQTAAPNGNEVEAKSREEMEAYTQYLTRLKYKEVTEEGWEEQRKTPVAK
jgi:hypothetical protein